MKKITLIILSLVAVLNISFLASSKEVDIPDANLEAVMREVLDKPEGPIDAEDLEDLTELDACEQEITDITGIEHCINLQKLDLSGNKIIELIPLSGLSELQALMLEDNQIADLTPLTELTKLEKVILNSNEIVDINPLGELINLEQLKLNNNEIVDLGPLSHLSKLQLLHLNQNKITDISDLTNLADLRVLYLDNNNIENISPLAALTELGEWKAVWMIHLGLANNRISDINPIFQNPGIGEGDVVDLRNNPLSNPEKIKNAANSKGVTILLTTDSEISLALEGSTSLGDVFTIKVNAEKFSDLAGFQFNMKFNSDLLEPQEIAEGPFLKQDGYTFWIEPEIGDDAIRDISSNLLSGGVDGAGELAKISFKAIGYGTDIIKLDNIKLLNSKAEPIYISAPDSLEITIPSPYDLNKDGKINIFDLVLVGNHFGESGPEGDVNNDGKVDIFDLVIIGNHFGEVLAAPSKWEGGKTVKGKMITSLPNHPITTDLLLPNYPNPANPETWIPFQIAEEADVSVSIYDSAGRLIRSIRLGEMPAGIYLDKEHAVYWDGRNNTGEKVSSGVYFYHLKAGNYSATRRMLILK